VTSLDSSEQVIFAPPPIIVRNYQEAERWGELCATVVKETGGKAILDEVGRIRRERERKDLERALQRSMRQQEEGAGAATPGAEVHEGLQWLVKTLVGESKTAPLPGEMS
jgi:hydroxymethylbilane synthase